MPFIFMVIGCSTKNFLPNISHFLPATLLPQLYNLFIIWGFLPYGPDCLPGSFARLLATTIAPDGKSYNQSYVTWYLPPNVTDYAWAGVSCTRQPKRCYCTIAFQSFERSSCACFFLTNSNKLRDMFVLLTIAKKYPSFDCFFHAFHKFITKCIFLEHE